MKKLWCGTVVMAALLLTASSAFATDLTDLSLRAEIFGDGSCGERSTVAKEPPVGSFPNQYSSTTQSGCCTIFGCCAHVESGCESCAGGRRWYSVYSCPDGVHICTARPTKCPTPC